jgi:hypothetical protein
MRSALIAFICVSSGVLVDAQSVNGVDYPGDQADFKSASTKRGVAPLTAAEIPFEGVKLAPLSNEERSPRKRGMAMHAGAVRSVTGAGEADLQWSLQAGGRLAGKLLIEWGGASRMRVRFSAFDANGGEVWIRDGSGAAAAGPFTGQGPFSDGDFWTPSVAGDRLIVEWIGPEPATYPAPSPQFQIDRAAYDWSGGPTSVGGTCHIDATCRPEYATEARAVANYEFVGDDGALHFCSGSLLNTRRSSFTPLFVTANHCITSQSEARSMVSYWGFQTAKCDGDPPDLSKAQQISGAELLLAYDMNVGDFSLVRLSRVPANAHFLGWNAQEPPVGSKVIGIHHPGLPPLNYKRMMIGEREWDRAGTISVDGIPVAEKFFYQVYENEGRTEPGSSGSPLLNENKQLVGVVSYGPVPPPGFTYCDIRGETAYGKFSAVYPLMQPYLEELAAPSIRLNRSIVNYSYTDGKPQGPDRHQVSVLTDSKAPVSFRAAASAPWVAVKEATGLTGAEAPGTIELAVIPEFLKAPGKHRATVTVSLNASPQWATQPRPVTFDVEVDKASTQPVVSAAINPNPVIETPVNSKGYNFRFTLRLEESAGVEARITSLKMDGQDYSARLQQILGTDRISPGGAVEKVIEGYMEPSPNERLFEVEGWSPATGARWSAKATARFLPAQ